MKNMANKAMASRSLKEAYDDGFTEACRKVTHTSTMMAMM